MGVRMGWGIRQAGRAEQGEQGMRARCHVPKKTYTKSNDDQTTGVIPHLVLSCWRTENPKCLSSRQAGPPPVPGRQVPTKFQAGRPPTSMTRPPQTAAAAPALDPKPPPHSKP